MQAQLTFSLRTLEFRGKQSSTSTTPKQAKSPKHAKHGWLTREMLPSRRSHALRCTLSRKTCRVIHHALESICLLGAQARHARARSSLIARGRSPSHRRSPHRRSTRENNCADTRTAPITALSHAACPSGRDWVARAGETSGAGARRPLLLAVVADAPAHTGGPITCGP